MAPLIIALTLCLIVTPKVGQRSGCIKDLFPLNGERFYEKHTKARVDIAESTFVIVIINMNGWFMATFPVLLSFQKEFDILLKVFKDCFLFK